MAANIRAAIKGAKAEEEGGGGPSPSSLSAPLPSKWAPNNGLEMMLVTLGRGGGTGHLGKWLRFPGLAVAAIKGRDLFVGPGPGSAWPRVQSGERNRGREREGGRES